MSNGRERSRNSGQGENIDINTYCKNNWPKLKKAAETAIGLEPDFKKKAKMAKELADLAFDMAGEIMITRYQFPEPAADFEKLLKEANQDVEKQRRLQEIFDKSVQMAGQAVDFTQKVVAFLVKYGKYLAMV
jgi:hypothetical protein